MRERIRYWLIDCDGWIYVTAVAVGLFVTIGIPLICYAVFG